MNEDAWQKKVREVAQLYNWRVYHTHDSRRSDAGFPDLTMVKGQRLVFAELKSDTGRVRPDQKDWLRDLTVAGVEVALWRPSDLQTVLRVLGPRGERAALPPETSWL